MRAASHAVRTSIALGNRLGSDGIAARFSRTSARSARLSAVSRMLRSASCFAPGLLANDNDFRDEAVEVAAEQRSVTLRQGLHLHRHGPPAVLAVGEDVDALGVPGGRVAGWQGTEGIRRGRGPPLDRCQREAIQALPASSGRPMGRRKSDKLRNPVRNLCQIDVAVGIGPYTVRYQRSAAPPKQPAL